MKRPFPRCGHTPGALSPEDQAAVNQFRALLAALRDMEPWTPASTGTSPYASDRSWKGPTPARATTTIPT